MKTEIYKKLKAAYPDLRFFAQADLMQYFPELLNELLEKEKDYFSALLETKNSDICFETFDYRSELSYFFGIIEHINSVHWSDISRKIIQDFEPEYMKFSNELAYSKRYYEMLKICQETDSLDTEQSKIISDAIEAYELRWIHLEEIEQSRLKKINEDISELRRMFSVNALKSEEALSCHIKDTEVIHEMPEAQRKSAKLAAEDRDLDGYYFWSSISEFINLMKYCSDSQIRKKISQERNSVASNWEYDNRDIIFKILSLKKEKAQILWYKNYAELSLQTKMAQDPEQVLDMLDKISQRARQKTEKEIETLKQYFKLDALEAWDTSYYFRKYKEEIYDFDEAELKKYFEYEKVLSGMFTIMQKLYDFEVKKIESSQIYGKQIDYYEIHKGWELLSYFMVDPYYSPEKRSGAWANMIQERDSAHTPFVVNVYNIKKEASWPTLLTMGEVETMFHEFWHAMHAIFSSSKYSELNWFQVERDFVELPSQFHEHYCREREWLKLFAKHVDSWASIPEEHLATLESIEHMSSGNMTLWQCVYASLDMKLHSIDQIRDIAHMDELILWLVNEISYFKKEDEYKMYCAFSHIFDGGYAAWYYSYMWSEILELDIWSRYKKEWIFSDISNEFYNTILSQWSKKKAQDLFYDFMKRDISLDGFFAYKQL